MLGKIIHPMLQLLTSTPASLFLDMSVSIAALVTFRFRTVLQIIESC